jgi:hypothetical protein
MPVVVAVGRLVPLMLTVVVLNLDLLDWLLLLLAVVSPLFGIAGGGALQLF